MGEKDDCSSLSMVVEPSCRLNVPLMGGAAAATLATSTFICAGHASSAYESTDSAPDACTRSTRLITQSTSIQFVLAAPAICTSICTTVSRQADGRLKGPPGGVQGAARGRTRGRQGAYKGPPGGVQGAARGRTRGRQGRTRGRQGAYRSVEDGEQRQVVKTSDGRDGDREETVIGPRDVNRFSVPLGCLQPPPVCEICRDRININTPQSPLNYCYYMSLQPN